MLIENGVSVKLREFDTVHGFLSLKIEPYSEKANQEIKIFMNE
jgi:hypothetical protein